MEDLKLHLLLADDDMDDCDFFQEALDEIAMPLDLTTVNDGAALMDFLLANNVNHPDVIFLDLNMPRKSGMECMVEIKSSPTLAHIPVIIYSTSLDHLIINHLFDMGAHRYIQKPNEFSKLKAVINRAIHLFSTDTLQTPTKDQFILQP
ncbi:MAG: response regulator [Aquaticitalea sp.]